MSLKIIITYKTKINPDIFPPRLLVSCLVSAIVSADKGRAKCTQVGATYSCEGSQKRSCQSSTLQAMTQEAISAVCLGGNQRSKEPKK